MKVIIDTDPGNDDAIAILLAIASPEIEILGLTVVAGNVSLSNTSRNARMICELGSEELIPVYEGAAHPLSKPPVTAEEVHGVSGLEGADIFEPKAHAETQHAVDWMIETVHSNPGEMILCALGPLTNIAHAILKEPEFSQQVRELVIMGGSRAAGGNVTPTAEFNFYADPHAADIVLKSGIPITLAPLDVTHKASMTKAWIEGFADQGPVGTFAHQILIPSYQFNLRRNGGLFFPLHDPCVIAYLIQPSLFQSKMVNVEIENESDLTQGATSIDWWFVTDKSPNCRVLYDIDADRFFDLIYDRLINLPRNR